MTDILVEALEKCRDQFEFYANEHQAKADSSRVEARKCIGGDTAAMLNSDARNRQKKADTNRQFAEIARSALTAFRSAPQVGEDAKQLTSSLDGLCAWLLHRFGPDSPEGREAACRMPSARAARTTHGMEAEEVVRFGCADHATREPSQQVVSALRASVPSADDIAFEALKRVHGWLCSVADCDMDEIVADGGITAAMVVRQEAAEQQRRARAAIAQAIEARSGKTGTGLIGEADESAVASAMRPNPVPTTPPSEKAG